MDDLQQELSAWLNGDKSAPAKAPPKPRSLWKRFVDGVTEAGYNSPLGAGALYRADRMNRGATSEEVNAEERSRLEGFAQAREDDPILGSGGLQGAVIRGVTDLAAGIIGGVDPTYALNPGKTIIQKALGQGGINAGMDAISQGIQLARGVRDKYSGTQTGIAGAGGVVLGGGAAALGARNRGPQLPAPGRITSQFGQRRAPKVGASTMHGGMDIAMRRGTPIKASADGVVTNIGRGHAKRGNWVEVDYGGGLTSRYLHLDGFNVKVGDTVQGNRPFARSGATGNVTGPHLHWSVYKNGKPIDPRSVDFNAGRGASSRPEEVEQDAPQMAEAPREDFLGDAENALNDIDLPVGDTPGGKMIVFHGGSDFDDIDPKMLGTGEPGGIRPLGKGLYGVHASNKEEAVAAIDLARHFAKKYGRGDKTIHAFEVDVPVGGIRSSDDFMPEVRSQEQLAVKDLFTKAENLPVGPERRAAYEKAREAMDKLPEVGVRTEVLPGGRREVSILDPKLAKRIGKYPADTADDEIIGQIFPDEGLAGKIGRSLKEMLKDEQGSVPRGPTNAELLAQAKKLGIDTSNIKDLAELRKLIEFHGGLKTKMAESMKASSEAVEKARGEGKFKYEVGDRILTPKGEELGQEPWRITGYYVDHKNPDRYGYRVERGKKGKDEDDPESTYESSQLIINDPKMDAKFKEMGRDFDRAADVAAWKKVADTSAEVKQFPTKGPVKEVLTPAEKQEMDASAPKPDNKNNGASKVVTNGSNPAKKASNDGPENKVVEGYHGSADNIEAFQLNRDRQGRPVTRGARGMVSFSMNPEFAKAYAGKKGTVVTAHIDTTNFADFRNPDHVAKVIAHREEAFDKWMADAKKEYPAVWTPERIAEERARRVEVDKIKAGAWEYWEDTGLWKKHGWDGAWMKETGASKHEGLNISTNNLDKIKMVSKELVNKVVKTIKDIIDDDEGSFRPFGRRYAADEGRVEQANDLPDGPVKRLVDALNGLKPLAKDQKKLYAEERAKRLAGVARAQAMNGGEAGFHQELAQLKGSMAKVEFESIRAQFDQNEIDELFDMVRTSERMTLFDKLTTRTALSKLLGADGASVPTAREIELLGEVFPKELIDGLMKNKSFRQKLGEHITNALNLPRAMMATLDLSAPFRQGIVFVGRKEFWNSFAHMFKQYGSERAYNAVQDEIASRPTYKLMLQSRLALSKLDGALSQREEDFMTNWAEKIPVFGLAARASNRAYSGFLNKLRADVFDTMVRQGREAGIDFKHNHKALKDIANFVNAATGRGSLGKLTQAAPALNGIFFSPRLIASRLQMLNPAFYVKMEPFVRKQAIKSVMGFGGIALTVLGIAKMGGAEVEHDPRATDFGKIKVGKTRYDVLGGFQQYVRLGAQLISGTAVNSNSGKESDLTETKFASTTRKDKVEQFSRSKLSPVASFIVDLLDNKSVIGEPVEFPKAITDRFIPLIVQDTIESVKEYGAKGMLNAIPAMFGVGTMTYTPKTPKKSKTAKSEMDEWLDSGTDSEEDASAELDSWLSGED